MLSKLPFLPEQASTVAKQVDALYFFLIGVSAFFALLIAVGIVSFAIKYRRRSDDEIPRPIHGSLAVELTWTLIPFGLAMVIFFWGASVYLTISRPPDDALEVFAVGKQWMWKLQHLEGRREINELHVPIGRAIKLTMTSEDVIHSFYVPAFRIKADVLPGRYTTTWFQATKAGTYHLFCAEYCGTEHAKMIGRVVVMELADFQAWLSGETAAVVATSAAGSGVAEVPGVSLAAIGEAVFQQRGCLTCHQDVSGALGPSLVGLYGKSVQLQSGETVVANEDYLRESILNPQAKIAAGYMPVMPTFQGQLGEEEILQLIQYIKSLEGAERGGQEAVGSAPSEPAAGA